MATPLDVCTRRAENWGACDPWRPHCAQRSVGKRDATGRGSGIASRQSRNLLRYYFRTVHRVCAKQIVRPCSKQVPPRVRALVVGISWFTPAHALCVGPLPSSHSSSSLCAEKTNRASQRTRHASWRASSPVLSSIDTLSKLIRLRRKGFDSEEKVFFSIKGQLMNEVDFTTATFGYQVPLVTARGLSLPASARC